jgi:tRNA 2-thiouridine synthesizing protein B
MIPLAQVNNMLHIINKSFSESDAFASCVKHALPNSLILLYENAVLSAVKGAPGSELLQQASTTCKIYALLPDIEARGKSIMKILLSWSYNINKFNHGSDCQIKI